MKPRVSSFRGDFSLTKRLKLGFNLISVRLGLRVGVFSLLFDFILPLDFSFSLSRSLDGSKARDGGTSRAQGKHPIEPSQPNQTKAHQKATYDTTLFSSIEDY